MPEACFLCLDSTEYMRNGDQFPTRLLAEQDAANLLVNAKLESNAENTIGFLVTGGSACTVHETLSSDVDQMMAAISAITIKGNTCHFRAGLLIAALALSHRTNPRAEKRIVVFVGTPLHESERELEQLAKRLRKDDVAVDVIAFGVESNVPLLESFVNKVNRNGTSRFLSVTREQNLTDALMSSSILMERDESHSAAAAGNDNPAMQIAGLSEGNAGQRGAHGDVGFNVDPNVDPELALAIRLSMEEEQQRQAALAAASAANTANAAASSIPTPHNNANTDTNQANTQHEENENDDNNEEQNASDDNDDDENSMTEEEMLQKAIQMSLEDAEENDHTANAEGNNDEDAFENELRKELNNNDKKNNDSNDDKDEEGSNVQKHHK